MRWHAKLGLVFGGMAAAFVGLVIYEERAEGTPIWEAWAPGAAGRLSVLQFEIPEPGGSYVLTVHPYIESGWGWPDVVLQLRIRDPSGAQVLALGEETVFGRAIFGPENIRTYAAYEQRFPFRTQRAGTHELTLRVLSGHVSDVYLAVGRKGEG